MDWEGEIVNEVTDKIMSRFLGELTMCAFRYDLLALKRVLVPRRTDPTYEVERKELLADVFKDKDTRAPSSIPRGPIGLAHGNIHSGRYCNEALRRVIIRWPLNRRLPPSMEISLTTSVDDLAAVEKDLITTYVNTFFECPGRSPSIPHIPPVQPKWTL